VKSPEFLDIQHIKELHAGSLRGWGGRNGLRDESSLAAAVKQPMTTFHYKECDLYDISAFYCFHISEAQAFIDGNKRTAVAAALLFLELNGVNTTDQDITVSMYDAVIAIAENKINVDQLADIIRKLFGQVS